MSVYIFCIHLQNVKKVPTADLQLLELLISCWEPQINAAIFLLCRNIFRSMCFLHTCAESHLPMKK